MEEPKKKVLVAEDDGMLRNIIVSQLSARYSLTAVPDGAEALLKIEAERPDIIILDLLMPKIDGFGVLEKLRHMPDAQAAKTPVIIFSNLKDPDSVARAQKYQVEEYFIKSDISMGILLNRINRFFTQGPVNKL